MDDLVVEHVLRAVEQVPAGRVVSYGGIAELVGGTARQVGSVMRFYGSNVTWWRVVNSYGDLPAHLRSEAAVHWAAEGIEWKPNGLGCRIAEYRVDEETWASAYERAVEDLPRLHRR
ncbi:MGMT family protein [Mobilicoccus caccae]|uniref:Methylated-DNA-[protein]-cysteine S-methyltransferase DNA binding domain-containing protein n=1 Tax=Mobilicoccus caccae TaxID=1859295 RepID=A0ABQ6IJU6_9MICO|nr:MGMT family protein [Mobilicoccus caccae]GMA38202.1 hypothetical protein GCM10025883_02470 [Mobilicoccus caccae]